MKNILKYGGWVVSIVLLVVVIVVYTGWNKANADSKAQADNFTASYNALVAQNTQREAQWQTSLTTLNSTWAAQYAQAQTNANTTVNAEVAKAVAAVNTQWQAALNAAVANASAQRDAQWLITTNTTVKNALAARDAQWKTALAAANITANLTVN